jgi:hypothetical protein
MRQLWILIFIVFLTGVLTNYSSTADSGKGALLTDRQLGHVIGGQTKRCGPVQGEACVQTKQEGPLSEIILWDEWGSQAGEPQHFTPGSILTARYGRSASPLKLGLGTSL